MKSRIFALFCLGALAGAGAAYARHGKKLTVPPAFQTAHTVFVQSADGEASRPGVSEADRMAIQQVMAGLKEWNRYTLVDSAQKADLVIVVRKGHAVGDADHLGLGPRPQPMAPPTAPGNPTLPPTPGANTSMGTPAMGGDDIAEQDTLRVYTVNAKGKMKGPIWSQQLDGGLNGPDVRLFQQLRAAVEITYPQQPAQQPAQ
ncbi:MAG: hypothetical protein ACLGSD_06340 [Acidobacteriota bacterium]